MVRIGFSVIYSWRPHVEQMIFLANLVEKAGHSAFFLTCDADLPTCYTREFRSRSATQECFLCRVSGVRSFRTRNVSSIGQYKGASADRSSAAREWADSSASTIGRFESDEDYSSTKFKELGDRIFPAVQMTYAAARAWIVAERLDAVCVFNGRMDATRAIFEAARSLGVRVISLERTWFGQGLQLYPEENCLGLHAVDALVTEWRDRPLTRKQALAGAVQLAKRFLRVNDNEWRAYNKNATDLPWPGANAVRKVLLIPSSRNEVWGHPDWRSGWRDATSGYDALMTHLDLPASDVVLRCHPNWSEMIGNQGGQLSESHYANWAARRGILCIPSSDSVSTLGLIERCDVAVVTNGSAALEAGLLGKQVIGLAPATYEAAGIRDSACNAVELENVILRDTLSRETMASLARLSARHTLRFCYTMVGRVPQYSDAVVANATTNYAFDENADPESFMDLLRTGQLKAYDQDFSQNTADEDWILELIEARNWLKICNSSQTASPVFPPLKRRFLYQPVDFASRRMPVGDR